MTTVSTIVTADSKKDGGIGHVRLEWPVTIRWNERSRSFGIGGHVGVEYAEAERVLLDQRLFDLDTEAFDAFCAALEAPPGDNEALRSLLSRKAPWD